MRGRVRRHQRRAAREGATVIDGLLTLVLVLAGTGTGYSLGVARGRALEADARERIVQTLHGLMERSEVEAARRMLRYQAHRQATKK